MIILASLENHSKKLTTAVALGAVALTGATLVGTSQAHADTRIDSNTIEVTAGDTLSGVAAKYGVDMNQLAQANQIQNPNLIVVGQRLHLNGSQAAAVQTQAVHQPVQQQTQAAQTQSAPAVQQPVQQQTQAAQTQSAPAAQHQTQAVQQPVQQQTQAVQTQSAPAPAPAANASTSYQAPSLGGDEQAAKDWIAARESGGSYSATNGQYIGKYQLSASYLHGDYSPANQERTANSYVQGRYGSWTAAQSFWQAHGWY